MAMPLFLPRRSACFQPQGGPLQIDRSHPIARGLVAYMPLTGRAYQDVADKAAWTVAATATPAAFDAIPRGLGIRIKGATAAYMSRPLPAAVSTADIQPLTIRFRLNLRSVASSHAIMSWGSVAQDTAPRFYVKLSGGSLTFFFGSGYHNYVAPVVAGGEYIVTHTFATDGGTQSTYLNGVLVGSAFVTWAGNASTLFLGTGFDGLTASSDFVLSDFAMWNRQLSAQEVVSDAQNPWQMFVAPQRVLAKGASAAGPTYTLAGVGGALSVTGAAAGLKASRRLVAPGGALVLAGGAATLAASRKLIAATGAIAIAGSVAGLSASRRLAANGGALAVDGSAAFLVAARRISANVGSLAVNGAGARLVAGRALPASGGALTVAGSGALLRAARRLLAGTGSLSLTGAALTFIYSPVQAGTGATYTLVAGSGALAVSGAAAAIAASRKIAASSGSLALSGSAARIAASRRLVASSGSLVVDGVGSVLLASRRMVAATGGISTAGAGATLRYSGRVTFARAPAGTGYSPRRRAQPQRQAVTSEPRIPVFQRNDR